MKTYPLTHAQMGIWLACQGQGASAAYQLPCAIPFSTKVEAQRLTEALRRVIAHRAVLHTRLLMEDAQTPRQWSDTHMHIDVPCSSMTEAQARRYIDEGFIRPFDLKKPQPLCRFEVVATEEHTWLLMDFHHIIADGMTIADLLMHRDLPDAYDGRDLTPDDDALYRLANDEEASNGGAAYQADRDYYHHLFGDISFTALPLDRGGGNGTDIVVRHRLPRTGIDQWCEQQAVAPNLLMMAAFCITLSKLCHMQKVAFATLSHGRNSRQLRQAYGMFVKTVPFVSDAKPEADILDYVRSIRPQLMGAIRHAAYPYVHFCRDSHHTANVTFAFQGADILEQIHLAQESTVGLQLDKKSVANDLSCVVYCYEQAYEWRIDASAARRDEASLRLFAHAMENCLQHIMRHPHDKVADVELTDASERASILARSQGETTNFDGNNTFVARLDRQARRSPQAIAIDDGHEQWTYARLTQTSATLAQWLASKGIGPGTKVGVMAVPRCGFLAATVAVMRTGAAYLPIDTAWPENYRASIASEAQLLLTLHPEHLPQPAGSTRRTDDATDEAPDPSTWPDASTPDGIAYIIYTSGTTGKPKGVMIAHSALDHFTQFIARRWGLTNNSRISCHAPLTFDASVEDLYPVLTVGGTLYLMPETVRHDIEGIHRFIDDNDITGGCYTTSLGMMVASRHHPSLQYICLGGERMTQAPQTDCRVINTYGPTEFCVDATYYILEPHRHYDSIPIGRPLDDTWAVVTDQHGRLLPWGAVGELCLAGVQMARGYWNDEKLSSRLFTHCDFLQQRIYHTGDLARWNDEGLLEYMGRRDHLVKVNGFRVSTDQVEQIIGRLQGVDEACVTTCHQGNACRLCAFFTSKAELDTTALQSAMRKQCPEYMVPARWVRMEKLPRLGNGKIDRQQLTVPTPQPKHDNQPATELQQRLCKAFAQALQVEHMGIDDDFFGMGGSSLTAMALVAELARQGIDVPYTMVFAHPTPRRLAATLDKKHEDNEYRAADDTPAIRQLLAKATMPLASKDRGKQHTTKGGVTAQRGNVLITGATGFLGIHFLHEWLTLGQGRIGCLVRATTKEEGRSRLEKTYKYYFDKGFSPEQHERLSVVAGDLTEGQWMEEWEGERALVVNCAADVRHFADARQLMAVNADALRTLAAFCKEKKARLVQVSTLGIAGLYATSTGCQHCLTERQLGIGQHFAEPYTYSKFMAERLLLGLMAEHDLKANIIRVGNLAPRSYDGRFQRNADSHALNNVLQLFTRMGMMPASAAMLPVDRSPVDIVAKAVLALATLPAEWPVWQVAHPQPTTMAHLLTHHSSDLLAAQQTRVQVVDDAVFHAQLAKVKADPDMARMALTALAYGSAANAYQPNAYDCSFTNSILQALGVTWTSGHHE